jgi:hypothetical protein
MRFTITATCFLATVLTVAPYAEAQGPVRRAARGAGVVAAESARAAARGVGAAADLATPGIPIEARAGGPVDRNARWRFQQRNGDWWYYSPDNTWSYRRDGQWKTYSADTFTPNPRYAVGYRGVDQSLDSQQMVFIDSGGRAVICQNGSITFMDGVALQRVSRTQVDAQGFLIQQDASQSQTNIGISGEDQFNSQGPALQSPTQAGEQRDVQPQAAAQAQGQTQPQSELNQGQATNQSQNSGQAPAQPPAPDAPTPSDSSSSDAATSDTSGDL